MSLAPRRIAPRAPFSNSPEAFRHHLLISGQRTTTVSHKTLMSSTTSWPVGVIPISQRSRRFSLMYSIRSKRSDASHRNRSQPGTALSVNKAEIRLLISKAYH